MFGDDMAHRRQPMPQHGRGDRGAENSHEHEHGEDILRNHPEVVTDVDHDQFHQRPGVHHDPQTAGLGVSQPGPARREITAHELSNGGGSDDRQTPAPERNGIQPIDIGAKTRVSEKNRKKEDCHKIRDLALPCGDELDLVEKQKAPATPPQ